MPLSSSPLQRSAVIAEARTQIGVPWVHQAHMRGVALDCIGLVGETCKALGFLEDFVYPPYGRTPKPGQISGYLDQFMSAIDPKDALPADVLYIAFRKHPIHLAFLSERDGAPTLLHADLLAGRVVEIYINTDLRSRVVAAWRLPGIE